MKVRLSGGQTEDEGVVFITEPVEGTICSETWNSDDAAVICKMLNKKYVHMNKIAFGFHLLLTL